MKMSRSHSNHLKKESCYDLYFLIAFKFCFVSNSNSIYVIDIRKFGGANFESILFDLQQNNVRFYVGQVYLKLIRIISRGGSPGGKGGGPWPSQFFLFF